MEINYNDIAMEKIHKLRFTNIADWQQFKAANEDNERIIAIAIPFETGMIPEPQQYDEEGNPLPITYVEGYHVDIMTTEVIQEWKPYTITGNHKWAHSFGYGEVVTAEDFTNLPDDTWLKADIQAYLTANNIEWRTSWTKDQLLSALL